MQRKTLRYAVALFAIAACSAAGATSPSTLRVGSLTLAYCNSDYDGYCGAIERPLDPTGVVPGTVTVGFEFYPRHDRAHASLGTIAPQEGGPGYSSTGTRDFYLGLFAPLRDHRDVVIIDKRGTGLSDAIGCEPLQSDSAPFLKAVAQCGHQLGPRAYFYGTAFAAGDIAAVLDALAVRQVDFYGDSYGTFVGQVFAALYPERIRTLILDSAYPVKPADPWFGSDWATAWSGIDTSCKRSPSCSRLGGRASDRVRELLEFVRGRPIAGLAYDADGNPSQVTVDPASLFYAIDSAGYGPVVYRDLDAAARAWLEEGDSAPLLRLIAETGANPVSAPVDYSEGLYVAVSCSDYPLLYDMTQGPGVRRRQYDLAVRQARDQRPDLFAPFSFDEAFESGAYITPLDTCLPWPKPPSSVVQGAPVPPTVHYPDTPTLVLSGDLDSITSPLDASEAAAQFPNAVHIVIPNLTHVVAGSDEIGCASALVLHFIEHREPGASNCRFRVRPVRTVARFAASSSALAPLVAQPANRGDRHALQVAAAALEGVGDSLARYGLSLSGSGRGLRGGTFTSTSDAGGYELQLSSYRFSEDVAISGTVTFSSRSSRVTAAVQIEDSGRNIGHLVARWRDSDADAVATVAGRLNGITIRGQRIAP